MKKLISLLLALVCLLSLTPVMAEEAAAPAVHAVNAPITLEAYQQAYEGLIATVLPESKVTWISAPLENGSETCMALLDESFVSVLLLPADGMVSEVAVLVEAPQSEDILMSFVTMSSFAGAALLIDEDTSAMDAMNAFMEELFAVFTDISSGTQPEDIYGLPGAISVTPSASNAETFQFYFVLSLAQ